MNRKREKVTGSHMMVTDPAGRGVRIFVMGKCTLVDITRGYCPAPVNMIMPPHHGSITENLLKLSPIIPCGGLIKRTLLSQGVIFMFWLMTDSISRFSERSAGYSALLKSSQYFSQRSFWSPARSASAPAALASPWSDNSREGNIKTIAKRRGGSGGQALSPPKIGDSEFVEIF